MTGWTSRILVGLRRIARYRLVIPIKRDRNPPDFVARGVAVGMVIALTPTVGVQMPMVALIWLLFRTISRQFDFSVIVAMAWTWVTNVFTGGPVYYVFFVTGQLMLGQHTDVQGYGIFVNMLSQSMHSDASFLESLWVYTAVVTDIRCSDVHRLHSLGYSGGLVFLSAGSSLQCCATGPPPEETRDQASAAK